jgi:hypothetical protein
MMDINTMLTAATSAVGLFDKIADEVKRFIKKDDTPDVPHEYRMKISRDGNDLVSKYDGVETQRITGQDLEKLRPDIFAHVRTLEGSMQNYYFIWSETYPQLALLSDPIQKAKVEAGLRREVLFMKKDLERILKFLEDCGFYLDDHYLGIRDALRDYN